MHGACTEAPCRHSTSAGVRRSSRSPAEGTRWTRVDTDAECKLRACNKRALPRGCLVFPVGRTITATVPRCVVGTPEYVPYEGGPLRCDVPHRGRALIHQGLRGGPWPDFAVDGSLLSWDVLDQYLSLAWPTFMTMRSAARARRRQWPYVRERLYGHRDRSWTGRIMRVVASPAVTCTLPWLPSLACDAALGGSGGYGP